MEHTALPPRLTAFIRNGNAWKWFAVFSAVVLLFYVLPIPDTLQSAVLGFFGLFTFACLLLGFLVWRPVPRWGWLLLGLSQLLYALGDVFRNLQNFNLSEALTLLNANFYLIGSVFFMLAMPMIYWHFRRLVRRDNLPEGLIIGLGFALLGWIVVISPYVTGAFPLTNWFDEIVYPAVLITLVFFASLYLLTPLGELWSFRLLFGTLAGLVAAQYLQTLILEGALVVPLNPSNAYALPDMISTGALICLGIAYLHPSFGKLAQLGPRATRRQVRWLDLLALALAFGVAPIIWLLQGAGAIELNTVVVILGMMAVFLLAEWRLAQLFQVLEQQNRDLLALDKLKNQFLANMTHELRTPLNSIINFSHFLMIGSYGEVNGEQREALTHISSSGRHLLSMINDVLDLAKIQADMVKLFVERDVSLNEELNAALAMARGLLADKPVTLVENVPAQLPLMTGDRRRIRQIFINLLSNACKFTDAGEIRVDAEQQNENFLVTIRDTGAGIAAQDGALVFEPFRQSHAGLEKGSGSGLGLPIAKSFVEAHHGKLWFESELNRGTTFYVLLPQRAPELERAAQV